MRGQKVCWIAAALRGCRMEAEAEAPSRKRRRRNLSKEYKAAILTALEFFEKEAQEGIKVPLQRSQQRAALCLGVGERSVQRIALEARRNGGVLQDQGAGGTRARRLTQEHITLIRALLRRHMLRGSRVSIRRLESLLKREGFPFSTSTVRRAMIDAGFEFVRGAAQDTVREQLQVVAARAAYVRQRLSNRVGATSAPHVPEVFISERFCSVTASGTVQWLDPYAPLATSRAGSRRRMCVVAAAFVRAVPGGAGDVEGGLVPGSLGAWPGGRQRQAAPAAGAQDEGGKWAPLSSAAFEEWFEDLCQEVHRTLGPSQLVMDSLPWHRRALDEPARLDVPHLQAWMLRHGLSNFGSRPSLAELLLAFRRERERRGAFAVSDIASRYAHTVAFAPSRHGELMPLECAWRAAAAGTQRLKFSSTSELDATLRSGMENWFADPAPWLDAVATARLVEDSFTRFDDTIAGREAQAGNGAPGDTGVAIKDKASEDEESEDEDEDGGGDDEGGDGVQVGGGAAAAADRSAHARGGARSAAGARAGRWAATARLSAAAMQGGGELDVVRLAADAARAMEAIAAAGSGGDVAAPSRTAEGGASAASAPAASLAGERGASAQAAAAAAAAVAAMARSTAQAGADGQGAEARGGDASTAARGEARSRQGAGETRDAGTSSRSLLPTAAQDAAGP